MNKFVWVALCVTLTGCTFDKNALGPWPVDALPDADSAPDVSVPDSGVHDTLGHDTLRDSVAEDTSQSDVLQQDTLVQQDVLPQTDAPPFAQCTGGSTYFSAQKVAQIHHCCGWKVDGTCDPRTPQQVMIAPGGVCIIICYDSAGNTILPDECCGLWLTDNSFSPWCDPGCMVIPGHEGETPVQSGCSWVRNCTNF